MQTTTKQKLLRLAAGSMFAAGTIFGSAVTAGADEGGPPVPAPSLPNVPTDPSEGLPVPLPGGGA